MRDKGRLRWREKRRRGENTTGYDRNSTGEEVRKDEVQCAD